jgi:hypothetical protein
MAGSGSLEIAIGPMSEEDACRLEAAARSIEPDLGTSTEQLHITARPGSDR